MSNASVTIFNANSEALGGTAVLWAPPPLVRDFKLPEHILDDIDVDIG